MQITNLKLLNFRNYDTLDLDFLNHNIIYGKNGVGKTNIVEAIYLLSLTKSFRSNNEKNMIKEDQEFTRVTGNVLDDIKREYQVILNKEGKRVKVDNNLYKKLSDYIFQIKIILFNPNDLQIIKDSPSIRRRLINISISNISNEYLKLLTDYHKVLKQRNAYLKTMYLNSNQDSNYLDVLTSKIIDLGLDIYNFRKEYIDEINELISDIYYQISGIENLKIIYLSDFNELTRKEIEKKYKDYKEKDMLFGTTRFGIHRDDLKFQFNDKDLKEYGSEGQKKNAIISYKLAEIKLFKEKIGKTPIFILDDLFSELDTEKIDNILNLLDDSVQTFITTTEIDNLSKKIKKESKIFHVTESGIKEEEV